MKTGGCWDYLVATTLQRVVDPDADPDRAASALWYYEGQRALVLRLLRLSGLPLPEKRPQEKIPYFTHYIHIIKESFIMTSTAFSRALPHTAPGAAPPMEPPPETLPEAEILSEKESPAFETVFEEDPEWVADLVTDLRACGLEDGQVDAVCAVFFKRLGPLLDELVAACAAEHQAEQLAAYFGGDERWAAIRHQLQAWGTAMLPPEACDALMATTEGVKTLYRLMTHTEPNLGPYGGVPGDMPAGIGLPRWGEQDRDAPGLGRRFTRLHARSALLA